MASTPYIKYFTKVQYNFHSKLQGYRLPGTGYCYIFETDTRDSCIVHHRSSTTTHRYKTIVHRYTFQIGNVQIEVLAETLSNVKRPCEK